MKTVLVVEEDTSLSKIYQEKLEHIGCKVAIATTGSEALNFCRSQNPDLILLDVMLPGGMNGFDVLEQLKKNANYTAIPVLVLTNLDSEAKTAFEIGAVDYLVKANTKIEDIIMKVKSLLSL